LSDGSGASDALIFQAGSFCLKTSLRRRFADPEQGRAAMVQMARRKTLLGPLLAPGTLLCLPTDGTGVAWLWTVGPWVTTLRAWMQRADATGNEPLLAEALLAYGEAAVRALILAARSGLVLDVHPSNFAMAEKRLAYLDDDIVPGDRIPAIGHSLMRRVDEYERWPAAIAAYVQGLESRISADLTPQEVLNLGLRDALVEVIVRCSAAQEARRRLVDGLDRAS
jgi:hypothetical protein